MTPIIDAPVVHVGDHALSQKSWFAVATMLKDGTVIMDVRQVLSNGMIVEGRDWLRPTDPHYKLVLQHLGPLKPGQRKAVPPWDGPGSTLPPDSPQNSQIRAHPRP